MNWPAREISSLIVGLLLGSAAAASAAEPLPGSVPPVDFRREVLPILQLHCAECHAFGNQEGGFRISSRAELLAGGDEGPAVVPGDSQSSRIIRLVAGQDGDLRMPPNGPRLSLEEVGALRAWIDQGCVWPAGVELSDPRREASRGHWAFQPLARPPVPDVRTAGWCRTPIDRFLIERLEAAGLEPAAEQPARMAMRRLHFGLLGLPPDPAEIDAYCAAAAESPGHAWEELVDRLLESPSFGERWGRHWLDIAHYADSDGMESDRDRRFAFPYRDFAIRSFNSDLPYDRFVRWQLAGDEYAPENAMAIAATGFLAAGPHEVLEPRLLEEERLRNRYNELDDILSTIGTGLLGLTIGCARCHDHKYDALSSRDYYSLMCAFHSGDRAEVPLGEEDEKALVFRDGGAEPAPTWLFRRADFYDRTQPVELGFPRLLLRGRSTHDYQAAARSNGSPPVASTLQRRALAEWISDADHGAGALLARVIVNRLWQHHFGEPLVASVGDFGVRALPPTHPQLLEWLADELVRSQWSLKHLHRLLVLSAAYRQSLGTAQGRDTDPENRFVGRVRPRRLEAEALRDSLLTVSGTLNRQMYGPAFKPPIASDAMLARNLKDAYPTNIVESAALRRRSVYMFHKRVVPYPLLQAFDKPDAQQSCGRRDRSTVAPQALTMLNDAFVRTVADDFATRLQVECSGETAEIVPRAFRLALGRAPDETEFASSLAFLRVQARERQQGEGTVDARAAERLAIVDFCQTLFASNEFLYID
jgi:hypothetical protein